MKPASINAAVEALAKIRQPHKSLPLMISELDDLLPTIASLIEGSRDHAALERVRDELIKNKVVMANAESLLRQWRAEFSFETYDPSARLRQGLA